MTQYERSSSLIDRPSGANTILRVADRIGREALAPRAQATDISTEPPRDNFADLAAGGLLGLSVPRQYGGLEADAVTRFEVLEALSRYCAVTPFILTQHMGVCASIAAGDSPLAPSILPELARGTLLVGIGASQLRRAGTPMLRAARVAGGYRLTGTVPWASGYELMTHIVLGAVVDGDGPLFFWLPFQTAPGISFGKPQDLAVMRAANTVTVRCDGLFVPDDAVIGDDRGSYWSATHGGALSNPVVFLLGIGAGCLDGLRASVERSGRLPQQERLEDLVQELQEHREQFYALTRRYTEGDQDTGVLDALLAARIATSTFVLRLTSIAIAAEGGSAHLRTNPAQRRLREAAFFLTATVNTSAREALVLGL